MVKGEEGREKGKNQLDADEVALFRATVGAVEPLPKQNRITPQAAPRQPLWSASTSPDPVPDTLSDIHDITPPDDYLSNGLSRMTLRKLRRGHWPIEDSLDLHGSHIDTARKLLQEFLHEAAQCNWRCVLIIHGKGINSQGGEAVLRKLTRHWLTQRPDVLAFCDAQPRDGGSGAVMVLLKAN
jgi:DNA-nicking Smr family endonuclease